MVRARLRGPLLRSVSRSFYLSVRLLPADVRDPVALAYLLARATDTIADTADIGADVRRANLSTLAGVIQGEIEPNELTAVNNSFAPRQENKAEGALLAALPVCLEWLNALPADDQDDVRDVLAKINRGQALDVERFGGAAGEIRSLATAADLDEYTYLVAGCVGEFWTRICARNVANFARRAEDEMLTLGVAYGKGLQLLNVLRDAGSDLQNGRCYLPRKELEKVGIAPADILQAPNYIVPLLQKWSDDAAHGLSEGLEYSCAIRSIRLRSATVLPALIGARTLALMRRAGPEMLLRRVKMPRIEVRRLTLSVLISAVSPRTLRKLFTRLSSA
jgi:farnesyl-diphosphate farnesyltransferase